MFARRIPRGGSGGFTVPEDELVIVAFLTRLSNIVVTEDTSFPYDEARVLDTAYWTWTGTPGDPLVCQQDHWCQVTLNSTTLGTGYGTTGLGSGTAAPNNADWLHVVTRNGLTLADFVLADRKQGTTGASAQLMSTTGHVYFYAGDEVRTIYQNAGAGLSTLLVESNPTDGPNYHTDTGPGTLSPHLILVKMAGDAP